MDANQQGTATLIVLDIVDLPERAPEIQRGAGQVAGQCLQLLFASIAGKGKNVNMVVDMKEWVVLPVRAVAFGDDALSKTPEGEKAFVERALEALEGNGLIKHQHR